MDIDALLDGIVNGEGDMAESSDTEAESAASDPDVEAALAAISSGPDPNHQSQTIACEHGASDTAARLWKLPEGDAIQHEPGWWPCQVLAEDLRSNLAGKQVVVRYASDCTGGDAPGLAWESIGRVLRHMGICNVSIEPIFGSEAPDATHCHKFLKQNSPRLRTLYKCMHARSKALKQGRGGPVMWTTERECRSNREDGSLEVKLPPKYGIDNYQ
eukprot:11161991-Lingulodinium_polyedra.AAC.1